MREHDSIWNCVPFDCVIAGGMVVPKKNMFNKGKKN